MTDHSFTPFAAGALGGPDWLRARRAVAAEQLTDRVWPTDSEEVWRYSRVNQFALSQYRPLTAEELGPPEVESAPGGGPLAAELGERGDRKSTRLNSSHPRLSRMPSSA